MLDYYEGVEIAIEELKKYQLKLEIEVVDTKGDSLEVIRILSNPNFQNLDSNTNKPFSTPKQLPQLTLKEVSQLKAPARFCPFKTSVKCDPQFPYRQIDGSCNNLDNLWWGQAEMPFKRFIDADYSDRKLFIYSFLFISF